MQEYPEEEVDRIIGEEIMRAEGTRKWYGPVARTRIHTLLMSRLCAAWSVPAVRTAVEAVAAAEAKILYLCGTKEIVFHFVDNAYDELMERLVACEHALDLALAAYAAWPDPCAVCGAVPKCVRESKPFTRGGQSRDKSCRPPTVEERASRFPTACSSKCRKSSRWAMRRF